MRPVVNTDQMRSWNGYEGTHWAENRDRWNAVNEGFNEPLLAAAGIKEEDSVLDIGCGAGRTARLAARQAGRGRVLGVDLSEPMLARARETAEQEGLGNLLFEYADAQVHAFEPATFDVAVSRFGVMFFADPVAAFANIAGALRPGGRLAFICGAGVERNEWLQMFAVLGEFLPANSFGTPGAPGMLSLADPDRTRTVLSAAGFEHIDVTHVETRGTWGRDADDAAAFMLSSGPGRHLMDQLAPEEQEQARRTLTEALRPHEHDGHVRLRGTAWLVTADRPDH